MNENINIERLQFLAGIEKKISGRIDESYKILREINNKDGNEIEPIVDTTVQNIISIPIISLSQKDLEASIMPEKLIKKEESEIPVEEIRNEIENLVEIVQDEEDRYEQPLELEIREKAVEHLKEFLRCYKELNEIQRKKIRKILQKVIQKIKEFE